MFIKKLMRLKSGNLDSNKFILRTQKGPFTDFVDKATEMLALISLSRPAFESQGRLRQQKATEQSQSY